jgi:hypothetical protein
MLNGSCKTSVYQSTKENTISGATNVGYVDLSAACTRGRTAISALVVEATWHPSAKSTAVAPGGAYESWLTLTVLEQVSYNI